MPLFNIVPSNFFKMFTTVNKHIYVDSLLVLYSEFKESNYMLTKLESTVALGKYFDKKIYDFQDEDNEPVPKNKTVSEYCNLIIRNFLKYGWLEEQNDVENLEVYVSMPPYASAFLETINEILNPDNSRTDNCVLSIYLNLKEISIAGSNEHMFLENAYGDTVKLNRLLQDIIHNMKLHFDSLLKQASIADVLNEHFYEYETNITDKSYHPLKTENNAFKYRTEIQKIIRELRYNDELQEKIAQRFKIDKKLNSEEEARIKVSIYLDEIMKTFDNVDGKLRQIDKKHNQYLHTSWDRVRYLSHRNKDLPGNIVKVIELLSHTNEDSQQVIEDISQSINLNNFKSLDKKALYVARSYQPKFDPEALIVERISSTELKNSRDKIIQEHSLKNSEFSVTNIIKYLDLNFGPNNGFSTRDVVVNNDTELIKLILAVGLAQKVQSKYQVKLLEGTVTTNGYTIPELYFERSELSAR